MTDNVFDRLRDLFESDGPVNWRLAREVAESTAGPAEPVDPWLAEEYEELTHTAVLRVAASSPLDPAAAPGPVMPLDRRSWASSTTEGYAYLAVPLAGRMGLAGGGPMGEMLAPLGPALMGMQMGAMVGAIGQRALARFDAGLPPASTKAIAYVVPNVEDFATDRGFDVRQVRLWVALNEVAYQAELSVPWVVQHLTSLVEGFAAGIDLDPGRLEERLGSVDDPAMLEGVFTDPSRLSGLLFSEPQREPLERLQAFVGVMAGYSHWVADRAAEGMLPQAEAMRTAADSRRDGADPAEQALQMLLGLDLGGDQANRGTAFCRNVVRRLGDEALARVWEGPHMLPTLDELDDEVGWAARVLLPDGG